MKHIDSLRLHLSNERCRLSESKTNSEKQLRNIYVKQLESEIEQEELFLNDIVKLQELFMDDDELLNQLVK